MKAPVEIAPRVPRSEDCSAPDVPPIDQPEAHNPAVMDSASAPMSDTSSVRPVEPAATAAEWRDRDRTDRLRSHHAHQVGES